MANILRGVPPLLRECGALLVEWLLRQFNLILAALCSCSNIILHSMSVEAVTTAYRVLRKHIVFVKYSVSWGRPQDERRERRLWWNTIFLEHLVPPHDCTSYARDLYNGTLSSLLQSTLLLIASILYVLYWTCSPPPIILIAIYLLMKPDKLFKIFIGIELRISNIFYH